MGFAILGTIALVLLTSGLIKQNEKLYMISSPFWLILGFYCFQLLAGTNPVTVWYGWLGIFSIIGGMYIIWDVVWGEFSEYRKAKQVPEDNSEDIDYESENREERNRQRDIVASKRHKKKIAKSSVLKALGGGKK